MSNQTDLVALMNSEEYKASSKAEMINFYRIQHPDREPLDPNLTFEQIFKKVSGRNYSDFVAENQNYQILKRREKRKNKYKKKIIRRSNFKVKHGTLTSTNFERFSDILRVNPGKRIIIFNIWIKTNETSKYKLISNYYNLRIRKPSHNVLQLKILPSNTGQTPRLHSYEIEYIKIPYVDDDRETSNRRYVELTDNIQNFFL